MKRFAQAGKALLRLLFLEPLTLKLALMVTLLFTAIPLAHAAIGGYVKVFLVWGALVGGADLLTRRRAVRHRYAGFLLLFALAYAVTMWLNRATVPLSANASGFLYMLLFFFVLFPYGEDADRARREVHLLAWAFTVVTCVFTVVCLVTFVLQIQYKTTVQVAADYVTPVVIGVSENRLHGIYNCNTGSTLNLISTAFSLLVLAKGTRWPGKIFHGVNLALQYICLLLTLSRAAWYMYVVLVGLYVLFVLPWRPGARLRPWLADGVQAVLAVAVALLIVALSVPVKVGMSYIPAAVSSLSEEEPAPTDKEDTPAEEIPADDRVDLSRVEDTDEVGVLTGRTELWRGGWQAFKKQPLFGTSREGMYDATAPYVAERWLANLHRGGLHNIALTVLVCSGGVGFAILLAFLLLSGARGLKWLWRRRGTAPGVTANSLLVLCVALLGVEMMEARLLYSATIFGFVFWTMYGYAMCLTDACEPERAARTGAYNRLATLRKGRAR